MTLNMGILGLARAREKLKTLAGTAPTLTRTEAERVAAAESAPADLETARRKLAEARERLQRRTA